MTSMINTRLETSPKVCGKCSEHCVVEVPLPISLLQLPQDVLVQLVRGMHVKDMLCLRSTHPAFRNLLDDHVTLWHHASFFDTWPSQENLRHFERAASQGNIESIVKLGIAYLYNEGLPKDQRGQKIESNGWKAANMFFRAERLTSHTPPFTWLFIRPPWSNSGNCCKECVYLNLRRLAEQSPDASVNVTLARTLMTHVNQEEVDFDPPGVEAKQQQVCRFLQEAREQGSSAAAFLLWHQKYDRQIMGPEADVAMQLEAVRELRNTANSPYCDVAAKIELCKLYASGRYGGITMEAAARFTRSFLSESSRVVNVSAMFDSRDVTQVMRYILVDWLVEVCTMKGYCSLTLHVALDIVDRFLSVHGISRERLQLLGVAAMVLCSRFLDRDIITIREGAWLTDNTYRYEDVVRMMGEITATLRGNFRVATTLDLVQIICRVSGDDGATTTLSEYICELALLHLDLGGLSTARQASAAVCLARLLRSAGSPWNQTLEIFTGLSYKDLIPAIILLHKKCLSAKCPVDHRSVELNAVRQRYASDQYHRVSLLTLGISESAAILMTGSRMRRICERRSAGARAKHTPIIRSPRSSSPCQTSFTSPTANKQLLLGLKPTRDSVTPPLVTVTKGEAFGSEKWSPGQQDDPNESLISGYEADREEDEDVQSDDRSREWSAPFQSICNQCFQSFHEFSTASSSDDDSRDVDPNYAFCCSRSLALRERKQIKNNKSCQNFCTKPANDDLEAEGQMSKKATFSTSSPDAPDQPRKRHKP